MIGSSKLLRAAKSLERAATNLFERLLDDISEEELAEIELEDEAFVRLEKTLDRMGIVLQYLLDEDGDHYRTVLDLSNLHLLRAFDLKKIKRSC